jgi:hypothetical protein
MKIILDFDDTIFNTYNLMQEFFKVFQKERFTEDQFWNTYRECKRISGDFDKNLFMDLSYKIKIFDKEKINEEINSIVKKSSKFIYPDFFNFAENFIKEDLILLSFGVTDFQKIKIKSSEIIPYFKKVVITSNDKTVDLESIFNKNNSEKIFFIDDRGEQIDKIKGKLPRIVTMKIERPQGGHINTIADYIVKDLNEAKNIINNLGK